MNTAKAFLLPGLGLLGAAMIAAPAMASDSKGGFALHGIGAQTCQVMLQEIHPAAPPAAAAPAAALLATTPAETPAAPPAVSPTASSATAPGTASPGTASPGAASPGAADPAAAAPAIAAAAAPAPAVTPASPAPAAAPAIPASMRPILTSWILGYLTASDRLVKDTFDETPVMSPEALTTMIMGVCQKYPDARVETVANTVFNQLAIAKVLRESPVVEARAGNHVVPIRKATLIAVQSTLLKNKLTKEPADGNFGSGTEAALKSFQKSQNLPETGLPDPATVVRLLIEMPTKAAAK
jgi:uncharacterized protein YneF (UPF0154 family)